MRRARLAAARIAWIEPRGSNRADQLFPIEDWWRMTGSNRRPPACKAGALPAELIPHDRRVVGLVGFEPTTPALSRRCSNQLSYRPLACLLTADKRERKNLSACFQKGGDPAAPSDTATLLRLHPSHESHRGNRPPCG